MNGQRLSEQFPGGCFIGFNAAVDRKAAEQLYFVCGQAIQNGYSAITLCLSSPGGDLPHAYYVVNILEALPVEITCYNVGSVESAANLIFLCGDYRYETNQGGW